jgi:hypothetical protein
VTDLPVPLHEWAARTLVGSRVTYARYLQLLEAQRAALRADDIDLLAQLAAEGVVVLGELEEGIRLPPNLIEALTQSVGPRRDDVERLLETVQLEVSSAHAEIRRFATALEARKTVMQAALARLHRPDPPNPGAAGSPG